MSLAASLPASLALAHFTSVWMGWRYLLSQRGEYAAFISWVSVIGLALGVAVLIVVISVMNGFDQELRSRILGTVPHVVILAPDQNAALPELDADVGVRAVFPFFEADGMVARNGGVNAVAVYGLDARGIAALDVLRDNMRQGSLQALVDTPGSLIMGAPLARYLGLFQGDSVNLVLTAPAGNTIKPRIERFQLAGTFEIGAELDYGLALIGYADARQRGLAATGRFGTRLMLVDPLVIDPTVAALRAQLPAEWQIVDWRADFGELFRAVRLEKAMMFLLLLLIVAVAAFNIVSAQTMLVHERRADIAILRTMGASGGLILRMVLVQGLSVATLGIGLGVALGVALAYRVTETVAALEQLFGARLLDAFYLDELPALIRVSDIVTISAMSLALCFVSALLPARRAAALHPADALHGG